MNRVIETETGFDCIVNNKQFGTWRSHVEAKAGQKTEEHRALRNTVFQALNNAVENGFPPIGPVIDIVSGLVTYDADLENSSVVEIAVHVEAWLAR